MEAHNYDPIHCENAAVTNRDGIATHHPTTLGIHSPDVAHSISEVHLLARVNYSLFRYGLHKGD